MLKTYRYLLGKTKEQAFAIGNEIAATITAQNPAPIKLKFEKVIYPLVHTEFCLDQNHYRFTSHVCSWLRNAMSDSNMKVSTIPSLSSTPKELRLCAETESLPSEKWWRIASSR